MALILGHDFTLLANHKCSNRLTCLKHNEMNYRGFFFFRHHVLFLPMYTKWARTPTHAPSKKNRCMSPANSKFPCLHPILQHTLPTSYSLVYEDVSEKIAVLAQYEQRVWIGPGCDDGFSCGRSCSQEQIRVEQRERVMHQSDQRAPVTHVCVSEQHLLQQPTDVPAQHGYTHTLRKRETIVTIISNIIKASRTMFDACMNHLQPVED